MIMTCETCNHQVVVCAKPLHKEARTSSTEARCGTCGTVYRVDVVVLRETDLTADELKKYQNKTS